MRVSAIVVNYRRAEMTLACLASVREALDRVDGATEVVVVDNGSGDGSPEAIRAAGHAANVIALPENLGFPSGASEGIRHSSGEWVALINNDVIVEPDALVQMLAAGERTPDIGSVAAQMRFAADPDVINSAGIGVDRLGIAHDRLLGQPVSAGEDQPVEVFGACGGAALHRRRMLDEIGGMDESYFFALDDVDLAWRAQMAGWRCLYAPAAVVHHHHGATTAHGSDVKYFHVGLNRVRTLAKNADGGALRRYGLLAVGFDVAYILYAAVADRTLAPLRGRLQGLREWRSYRRAGRPLRRPVELEPVLGLKAALRRRSSWARHSAARSERPAPADDRRDRPEEDLDVLSERVVLDVLALHRHALLEGQLAAAVDLHRPRDARAASAAGSARPPRSAPPATPPRGAARRGSSRPRSTFTSCGSSSRLVRRSSRPTRVTRGSWRSLNIGSASSSSVDHLGEPRLGVPDHRAELEHPERLAVVARRGAGGRAPGRASRAGRRARSPRTAGEQEHQGDAAPTTSTLRLSSMVERDGSQVRNSISGSSARWFSSTAVPSIARSGGATLSLTPSPRQSADDLRRACPRRGRAPPRPRARRAGCRSAPGQPTSLPATARPFSVASPLAHQLEVMAGLELELAGEGVGDPAAAQHAARAPAARVRRHSGRAPAAQAKARHEARSRHRERPRPRSVAPGSAVTIKGRSPPRRA